MRDYNLVGGLAIYTRFDDHDLILRSEVCWNYKLQIVFSFWSMVIKHVIKIKHRMLCLTGVYFREITDTIFVILHLYMSCLNVCSSGFVLHALLVGFLQDFLFCLDF